MLREITARQFTEWRAYADLEPFDEERADLRSAHIVQTLVNLKRGKKPAWKLKDCILHFGDEADGSKTPEQVQKQVANTMDLLMILHGSKRKNKG